MSTNTTKNIDLITDANGFRVYQYRILMIIGHINANVQFGKNFQTMYCYNRHSCLCTRWISGLVTGDGRMLKRVPRLASWWVTKCKNGGFALFWTKFSATS